MTCGRWAWRCLNPDPNHEGPCPLIPKWWNIKWRYRIRKAFR